MKSHLTTIATNLRSHRQVYELHAHLFHYSLHSSTFWVSHLITLCTRFNAPLSYTRFVFNSTPSPTVDLYTCMFKYFFHLRYHDEALPLFAKMREDGVAADEFVYPILIKSAGKYGLLLHSHVVKLGYVCNGVVSNAMMDGYAKFGDVGDARKMFDEMSVRGVVDWTVMISGYWRCGLHIEARVLFNLMPVRNVVSWTCMVTGFSKMKDLVSARWYFDQMPEKNVVSWTAMLSAYARVGDLTSARDLFDKARKKDVVSWNSMIAGYAQNGQSPQAIDLFRQMVETGSPKPNELTMVSVLSACGHLGALELGNWVVNFLLKAKIKLTLSGYNAMIFMYSKCGNMKDALRIFKQMDVRNVVSYNTLISGFAAHGHGNEAIDLMYKMQEDGLKPDHVTFIGVLTACSHLGLEEEGRKVFESIDNPSVVHYACMVDLLGRAGKLDEAMALIKKMPMEPHSGVYGSLLNACRVHRNVEMAEYVAERLFVLEPENSGNYVLLSNVYAALGRWKDVSRIRKTMQERGVAKGTGWSLVEYGGKMHKFCAGDRAHERTPDIYRVLSELKTKLRQSGYAADKDCTLADMEDEDKEEMVATHSEKLAISYALLVSEPGSTIRVVKNIRMCPDCHTAIKLLSKILGREINMRDNSRFHYFKDGVCSCNDYW